jgi:hypothetical protein
MAPTLTLPRLDGTLAPFTLSEPRRWAYPAAPFRERVAYAAAHVVADPRRDVDVFSENAIDWDATLAFRRHLWKYGFAIAEAMDTAQRGGGLTWTSAQELIRRSQAAAKAEGGAIAFGAGTDHLAPTPSVTLDEVRRAYEEQVGYVESVGGRVILMASRALAKAARSADDYRAIYGGVLRQVTRPVILHWLGDMFDPQLTGYWGTTDLGEAMEVCLGVIHEHRDKVDGIKISLLDAQREIDMRRRSAPRYWSWCAAPRPTATSRRRARWWPTGSRRSRRTRRSAGCGSASSRCTPRSRRSARASRRCGKRD